MNKLTYERAKQLYMPYNVDQMRHLCALRDLEIERLRAENAKLRELVHGLDHCTTWANEDGKDCWSCPLWHEKDCTAEDIERELGIEVEE